MVHSIVHDIWQINFSSRQQKWSLAMASQQHSALWEFGKIVTTKVFTAQLHDHLIKGSLYLLSALRRHFCPKNCTFWNIKMHTVCLAKLTSTNCIHYYNYIQQ